MILRALFLVLGLAVFWPGRVFAQLSQRASISWANDFFFIPDPSDRYYTNGFAAEWLAPVLERNPVNVLLWHPRRAEAARSGLLLKQDIFTPSRKDTLALLTDDRPFASVLSLTSYQSSAHAGKGWRWTSALELGVVGRPAGGRLVQNGFHHLVPTSEEVAGWANELRTGLLLNYLVSYRKRLWQSAWTRGEAGLRARVGTVHVDATPGVELAIGRVRDPFEVLVRPGSGPSLHASLIVGAEVSVVGYDGTLTGSLLSPDPRFYGVISPESVRGTGHLGFSLGTPRWQLEGRWVFTSPEFKGGEAHRYGTVGLSYWW